MPYRKDAAILGFKSKKGVLCGLDYLPAGCRPIEMTYQAQELLLHVTLAAT